MDLPIFPQNNRPVVTPSDLRSLKIHGIRAKTVTRSFDLDSIQEANPSSNETFRRTTTLVPTAVRGTGNSPITQRLVMRDCQRQRSVRSSTIPIFKFQQELIRRERQRLEAERASQAAADRRLLEKQVADEKIRLQNELYLEQLRQESRASRSDSTLPPNPGFQEPRYASNTQDIASQPTFPFPNRRTASSTAADNYDFNSVPPRQTFTTPPRLAQKGGVSDYQMSISGPTNNVENSVDKNSAAKTALAEQTVHSNKAYGFIFFMLMLSLGLNLYLAWISRGFYVRYNELADELRETFTSSV